MRRTLKTHTKKLMETLKTDPVLEDDLHHIEGYIECIKLLSVEGVDEETDFAPEKEK